MRVLHTPLVANLGIRAAPDVPTRPSVVYVADYGYMEGVPRGCTASGVLRILDGATCASQGVYDGVALNSPVTPAIGDLDGDGTPEIVAAATAGGLVALSVASDGSISQLWSTTMPDGSADTWGSADCQWGGVAIYDLDDDGAPEILFEGAVWHADGVRMTTLPGWVHIVHGTPVPVGDFDGDGKVEAVAGNATWELDAGAFTIESGFSTTVPAGFTAVADLGDFPGVAGDAPGLPEVVSVQGGMVSVRTLSGGLVAQTPSTTSGNGGPPTIADFDGDGVREIGVAFGGSYEVLDLAESGLHLWTQPSQDSSSSRTGSSVFDFNADGRAEVVYGDECFVRIYDGLSGEVLFSQARFSSTWTENPIVADADGDGSAEMVMGASAECMTPYCPEVDPIFAGLRCESAGDCPSGTCDAGLCRCADDTECPATYGCTDPLSGSGGSGQVCRAFHRDCVAGLRIYRDARDRWAGSRTIWNQHGYHVTNVNDDGTIPRTSAVHANWSDSTLNNFRQNVQGSLGPTPGPDSDHPVDHRRLRRPLEHLHAGHHLQPRRGLPRHGHPGRVRPNRRRRGAHPPLRSSDHRAGRARRLHDGELHRARPRRRRLRSDGRRRRPHRRVQRRQQQRPQRSQLPGLTQARRCRRPRTVGGCVEDDDGARRQAAHRLLSCGAMNRGATRTRLRAGGWAFALALVGCGGAQTPAETAAGASDRGCAAHEARLGTTCWSAEGTRWHVLADGPGGEYELDLALLAAGRVRADDQPSADPATDEWFQDGALLRVFLSDRFVEYRAEVTNGTVLLGEARNVRGQRWAFSASRVFGQQRCGAHEARVEGACLSMAGTRWALNTGGAPVLVEFLAEGALAAGPEVRAEDGWEQEGGALRFRIAGTRYRAELNDAARLRGTFEGAHEGRFSANRVESIPPLALP